MSGTIRTDITGLKFNRLTVVSLDQTVGRGGRRYWVCLCDCGEVVRVTTNKLRNGTTKSCGCYAADCLREMRYKHGKVKTPEFKTWTEMRQRCTNQNNLGYKNYGARGITVCERWESFEVFLEDVGIRPSPDFSLERVDNNKGYSPENCIWADKTVQARNRRNNLNYTYGGKTQCLSAWCEHFDLDRDTVYQRIRTLGWAFEKAITTPTRNPYTKKESHK